MKIRVSDIIIWIFFVLTIIFIFWYIFGNSPTLEQSILILILTLSIATIVKITKLETKFNFLARDFKNHKNEFKIHVENYHK